MTVAELRKALEAFPHDSTVFVEAEARGLVIADDPVEIRAAVLPDGPGAFGTHDFSEFGPIKGVVLAR